MRNTKKYAENRLQRIMLVFVKVFGEKYQKQSIKNTKNIIIMSLGSSSNSKRTQSPKDKATSAILK